MNIKHKVSAALIHYPVLDREGNKSATAVTPMTIHDMTRVARTYALEALYVVTPLRSQQRLIQRIDAHWSCGFGASYNPSRKEAMKLVRLAGSLNEVIQDAAQNGCQPRLVATGASGYHADTSFDVLRGNIFSRPDPFVLLFGTSWGLDRGMIDECDYVLEPIPGLSGYNHLPVREAAAIIIDRLLGRNGKAQE